MAATATFITALMSLYFENTDHANIGDAAGLQNSLADNSFWISLHTANPVAGDQTTSEISYTGYARVAVGRTAGWTIAAGNATNAAAITFGLMTAGAGGTATYVGIGFASAAAGSLDFSCLISDPVAGLAISAGITPEIAIGALDVDLTSP